MGVLPLLAACCNQDGQPFVGSLGSGPESHFFLISLVRTIKEEMTPGSDFLGS